MKMFRTTLASLFLLSLSVLTAGADPLEVGAPAPTLSATVDTGKAIDLAQVYEAGPVLVYFYPKSFTGGCTKQACNLRDNYPDITDSEITVIGVSGDDVETQARFREEYALPFHLVADTEGTLAGAFGVPVRNGNVPSRQSFLVVDGKIAWRDLQAKPVTQAEDALAAYSQLAK